MERIIKANIDADARLHHDKKYTGVMYENRSSTLHFSFDPVFDDYAKKIVFSNGAEDVITGDTYTIKNSITKLGKTTYYIQFLKGEQDLRTNPVLLEFDKCVNGETEVTEEETSAFNTLMLEFVDAKNELDTKIEEVNNLDISQEQTETGSKIIITNKDGASTEVELKNGVGIADITEEPSTEDDGTNVITITLTDGTSFSLTTKNGSKGHTGDKGETGEDGKDATINGFSTTEIVGTNDVTIITENGTITVDVVTLKKLSELINDVNMAATNQNNNFTAPQTINGTLTINGDIVQNGESYETHSEELYTKNDLIITRDGAVGGLAEGEYTGIEAKNYDGENDGQLVFDANGEARVGDKGDTQPLLTRDEIANLQTGQVLVWDGECLKAVGSSEFVKLSNLSNYANKQFVAENYESKEDLESDVQNVLPKRSNTLPNPFAAQTEYYLGVQTQVTINPPANVETSQYTLISFTAGTNFAIAIGEGIVGDTDYIFEAENYYEILLTFNGTNWIMNVLEV